MILRVLMPTNAISIPIYDSSAVCCPTLVADCRGKGGGGRNSREVLPKRTGCMRVSSVIQCQATNVTMKMNKDTPDITVYLSDLS